MDNINGLLHDSSAIMEKLEDLTPDKKRKQSAAEELTNCKKSRNDTQNTLSLNEVINLGIPHVGELIFESIDTPGLIKCLEVSQTWKVLAENVLIKRWKGKMFEACKSGETKVVQLLLERCNSEESGLNIRDENESTALMWACWNGHKDVVKLLLDHSERIDLNARNNNGETAFIFACYNGHKDVVKLLLDHSERIELNAKDDNGDTAFIWACSNGQKDVVKLLLDHYERIDLNTRDDDLNGESHAYTALMIAHRKGHQDIVQMVKSKLSYSSQFRFLRSRYVAIDLFLFVILFFCYFLCSCCSLLLRANHCVINFVSCST